MVHQVDGGVHRHDLGARLEGDVHDERERDGGTRAVEVEDVLADLWVGEKGSRETMHENRWRLD